MANARNTRTTHPRKAARRERAADRFYVIVGGGKTYLRNKSVEAFALGIIALFPELAKRLRRLP